jgi:hypothetical protein
VRPEDERQEDRGPAEIRSDHHESFGESVCESAGEWRE